MPGALLFFLYAQACLATLMLALGDPLPAPYALATVALAALAWRLTDHGGWALPGWLRDGLAALFTLLFALEAAATLGGPVLALGHLVVLLQATKFFCAKGLGDVRQLLGLGAVQAAVSCIVNREPGFGLALLGYLPMAGLALWRLERERLRNLGGLPALPTPPAARWRSAAFVAAALLLAAAIFRALPRSGDPAGNLQANSAGLQQLVVGYSPELSLKDGGSVAETADVAFTVRATGPDGKPARLPAEMLWRGIPLVDYRAGEWKPARIVRVGLRKPDYSPAVLPGRLKLRIEAQRERGLHAFGPLAVYWGQSEREAQEYLDLDRMEASLRLRSLLPAGERAVGTVLYTLVVSLDPAIVRPPEYQTPTAEYLRLASAAPPSLTRLQAFAREAVGDAATVDTKAERLMAALRGGGFGYSLTLPDAPRGADPVEEFLFGHQVGNCEMYASALCLMLRAADVPARIVQGYKGVDYNEAGEYHSVRQLHAHAWVEAYQGLGADRWTTFDPTPGTDRERLVETQRSRWQWFEDLAGAARNAWQESVIGYDNGAQGARLWAWLKGVGKELWTGLRAGGPWALATLAAGGATVLGLGWLLTRWRKLRTALVPGRPGPSWPEYAALLKLAKRTGCPKESWQTPLEHARQLSQHWQARPETAAHAALPLALVEAHYSQRYGQRPADAAHWRERLAEVRRSV